MAPDATRLCTILARTACCHEPRIKDATATYTNLSQDHPYIENSTEWCLQSVPLGDSAPLMQALTFSNERNLLTCKWGLHVCTYVSRSAYSTVCCHHILLRVLSFSQSIMYHHSTCILLSSVQQCLCQAWTLLTTTTMISKKKAERLRIFDINHVPVPSCSLL